MCDREHAPEFLMFIDAIMEFAQYINEPMDTLAVILHRPLFLPLSTLEEPVFCTFQLLS